MAGRLRVVFSGMVAADPHQGGATWAVLQYLLGFRRLGHDAHLVEPIPPRAVRPAGAPLAASANAAYFRQVAADFGLGPNMTLLREDTRETVGRPYDDLVRLADRAD